MPKAPKQTKFRKYINRLILFVVLFGLLRFLFTPLFIERRVVLPHDQNIIHDELISFAEMDSFLEVWSQYCQKGYPELIGSGISIYNEKIEDAAPKNISIWLKRRNWTVKRFYYVEDRMRSIVKTAILEQHLNSNKVTLSHSRNLDSKTLKNLKNIVNEQEQKLSIREVSKEEVQMVKENLELVDSILNCTTFYQP